MQAAEDIWMTSRAVDLKSGISIKFCCDGAVCDPWHPSHTVWAAGNLCPGVGAADLTSYGIIEISSPNIPNPDTHNDIPVIYLKFWCDGGQQVTLGWRAGRQTL